MIKNLNSKNRENKNNLLYIDAVCVLSIQSKKSQQPFRQPLLAAIQGTSCSRYRTIIAKAIFQEIGAGQWNS